MVIKLDTQEDLVFSEALHTGKEPDIPNALKASFEAQSLQAGLSLGGNPA